MAEAKIEIKVGAVSFSGEGEGKWVSEQLDKVLGRLQELANVAPAVREDGSGGAGGSGSIGTPKPTGTLAAFLRAKGATTNQVRKFIATAVWLHDHEGRDKLSTTDVSEALISAKQSELTNPSQCLAQNVTKGFCQKNGKKQFFVTDDGRAELGK